MKNLLAFFALFCIVRGVAAEVWTVSDPYIRAMPPGQSVTVAYLSLTNHSAVDCELNAVVSDLAERVEFHQHIHEQGMMKMRPIQTVQVPAGEQVDFSPGGLHIMLFDVTKNLQPGDQGRLRISSDQCPTIEVLADVRSPLDKVRN